LKLVCELHLRWGTFLPNLGTSLAIEFSKYSLCTRRTDRRMDGRTKATLVAPFLQGRGHNNLCEYFLLSY